jgi:hypothetical protein
MDKPLEKQPSLGPIGGSLRVTGTPFGMWRAGSALALYSGQHKIAGRCAESASTCGRRIRKGSHGNIHKDGYWIEHVDCTRSSTYEKLLSIFWTNERRSQEK